MDRERTAAASWSSPGRFGRAAWRPGPIGREKGFKGIDLVSMQGFTKREPAPTTPRCLKRLLPSARRMVAEGDKLMERSSPET
jgi:hypothetical protein